jgi:hypothetical protein
VRRADNLITFMCRLSSNLGASTSWNTQGLSRPGPQPPGNFRACPDLGLNLLENSGPFQTWPQPPGTLKACRDLASTSWKTHDLSRPGLPLLEHSSLSRPGLNLLEISGPVQTWPQPPGNLRACPDLSLNLLEPSGPVQTWPQPPGNLRACPDLASTSWKPQGLSRPGLSLLETSGPVQTCNGIALPSTL